MIQTNSIISIIKHNLYTGQLYILLVFGLCFNLQCRLHSFLFFFFFWVGVHTVAGYDHLLSVLHH